MARYTRQEAEDLGFYYVSDNSDEYHKEEEISSKDTVLELIRVASDDASIMQAAIAFDIWVKENSNV